MVLLQSLSIFTQKPLLILLGLGAFSGIPFLLILSTLSFWLAEEGVDKTTIGLFTAVSIPYSCKFLWAPIIDHMKIPYLSNAVGQKKSWGLVGQWGVCFFLLCLSFADHQTSPYYTALIALGVAFCAATQDIVLDTYRIQTIAAHESGYGAAMTSMGFRIGMFISGAGTIYLASATSWQHAYQIMAFVMLLGNCLFLFAKEPSISKKIHTFHSFGEFLKSFMVWKNFAYTKHLIVIIPFMLFYKFIDISITSMNAPFLYSLGCGKVEFATLANVFGLSAMLFGAFLGGILIQKKGLQSSLTFCLSLQICAAVTFFIQSALSHHYYYFIPALGVSSLCSGMASSTLIAYLSSLCSISEAATHFTFLYSFNSLSRVLISVMAGALADYLPWHSFYGILPFMGLICFYLLAKIPIPEPKKNPKA